MSESENLLGKFSVCKAVVDLNHNLIIFLHLKIEFYSSTSFLACSGNKWNAAYLLRNAMTTKQLKKLIKKSNYLKDEKPFSDHHLGRGDHFKNPIISKISYYFKIPHHHLWRVLSWRGCNGFNTREPDEQGNMRRFIRSYLKSYKMRDIKVVKVKVLLLTGVFNQLQHSSYKKRHLCDV